MTLINRTKRRFFFIVVSKIIVHFQINFRVRYIHLHCTLSTYLLFKINIIYGLGNQRQVFDLNYAYSAVKSCERQVFFLTLRLDNERYSWLYEGAGDDGPAGGARRTLAGGVRGSGWPGLVDGRPSGPRAGRGRAGALTISFRSKPSRLPTPTSRRSLN